MPKINRNLLLNWKVIVCLFILSFQFLDSKAQGLLFNSNDSLLTKRTSLKVFNADIPEFRDHLFINFDLSLWDNAHLGYVFNLAEKDNSYSLSYLYNDGAGYLNFNIDRKSNKIKIPLDASLLKKKKWMRVKIDLDLKGDRVSIYINNKVYQASQLGFADQMPANLIFGKNQYYTEVPNMAIRNLEVGNDSKKYLFPLDEWKGNSIRDQNGDVTGTVENPVWLINESYFWKPVYRRSFKDVAGLNFNTLDQSLFIFSKDSLITYNAELKRVTSLAYKNTCPVPMVLGKSIFNARENKCYIYELFDVPKGMPSVAALDMNKNNLTWEAIGKAALPQQRHHHNVFYDLKQDTFYMFGGYGSYSYYNTFLKYDKTVDKWEKVAFKGDRIDPRFFAATGNADKEDELFLFGGYGNESGNQVVGGKQLYDLFRINLKDHMVKKCWSIRPAKDVFVPANNLILSTDKKYFYALCYPHEIARTALRLYKFSVKDGSYEVVSAPLPVISERIESDINLFFNRNTDEFICTLQEFTDRKNSEIKVYSIASPPVSNVAYLASLNPQKRSKIKLIYIGIAVLILMTGLVLIYRKRSSVSLLKVEEDSDDLPVAAKDIEKRKNSVYLLGEFLVNNKHGKDITYLFSPKIKQLFILILLCSRDGHGCTSKKISSTLWPDKDISKTKNIKGVTFNHLRNIISDIDGIELTFLNDTYLFKISDDFFCDYFFVSDIIEKNQPGDDHLILEYFDLISRGTLLKDMPDQWLDDHKYNYEGRLIEVIQPELKKQYEAGDLKLVLEVTKLIFCIDPFSDMALKYQLKSLRRLKGIEYAHKIYDLFAAEYRRSLGTEYPVGFDRIVQ